MGPRLVRVRADTHRAAASARNRPPVWSTLAGGGHHLPPRPVRSWRRRKVDDWGGVRDYLDGLLSAHEAPVDRSTRPVVPRQATATPHRARWRVWRAEVADVPWWHAGRALLAWADAGRRHDDNIRRQEASVREGGDDAQAAADAWWGRLRAHDAATVTEHLDRCLVEHAMPATVTAVEGDRVHLVIPVLTAEKLIGPREPTTMEDGRQALPRITKTRRHELFGDAITSAMLAVAAEVFAASPGTGRIAMAVMAPRHVGGPAVLVIAELSRDLVLPEDADRPAETDLVGAAADGRASLLRDQSHELGALRPLDEHHPDVRTVLAALDLE